MITAAAALLVRCAGLRLLSKGGTAERKSAEGGKCDEFDFHMLCLMAGQNRGRLQFASECFAAARVGIL